MKCWSIFAVSSTFDNYCAKEEVNTKLQGYGFTFFSKRTVLGFACTKLVSVFVDVTMGGLLLSLSKTQSVVYTIVRTGP